MFYDIFFGSIIPLIGTTIGAGFVFFARKNSNLSFVYLNGASAGIMLSASIWSLLLPSLENAENMGKWAILPCVIGFSLGMGFMLLLQKLTLNIEVFALNNDKEKIKRKNLLSFLAVTVHNFPEGMAVGAIFSSAILEKGEIPFSAMALPIGIALQNIPEGAIISLPWYYNGMSKGKAFSLGILSGIVEPVAAIITIILSSCLVSALPYFLSFAAGAMVFVVLTELVCDGEKESDIYRYILSFTLGFCAMMSLDVLLS